MSTTRKCSLNTPSILTIVIITALSITLTALSNSVLAYPLHYPNIQTIDSFADLIICVPYINYTTSRIPFVYVILASPFNGKSVISFNKLRICYNFSNIVMSRVYNFLTTTLVVFNGSVVAILRPADAVIHRFYLICLMPFKNIVIPIAEWVSYEKVPYNITVVYTVAKEGTLRDSIGKVCMNITRAWKHNCMYINVKCRRCNYELVLDSGKYSLEMSISFRNSSCASLDIFLRVHGLAIPGRLKICGEGSGYVEYVFSSLKTRSLLYCIDFLGKFNLSSFPIVWAFNTTILRSRPSAECSTSMSFSELLQLLRKFAVYEFGHNVSNPAYIVDIPLCKNVHVLMPVAYLYYKPNDVKVTWIVHVIKYRGPVKTVNSREVFSLNWVLKAKGWIVILHRPYIITITSNTPKDILKIHIIVKAHNKEYTSNMLIVKRILKLT